MTVRFYNIREDSIEEHYAHAKIPSQVIAAMPKGAIEDIVLDWLDFIEYDGGPVSMTLRKREMIDHAKAVKNQLDELHRRSS